MNKLQVSAFMLERYRIGEVTQEEKIQIEEALACDEALSTAFENLSHADNDFYQRYPMENFFPAKKNTLSHIQQRHWRRRPIVWGICAAAMIMVIALPLLIPRLSMQSSNPIEMAYTDRMKGGNPTSSAAENNSIELSIYLRGNTTGEIIRLSDYSNIREGNTIQLAYRVLGASSKEKYGVIFSIDGRSFVTMHYPYTPWQSTLLVSGRAVPLDEAFTLDDAPDYEIFFFVAADTPIDIRYIINSARRIASQIGENPQEALRLGVSAFKDYELNVFTLIKE